MLRLGARSGYDVKQLVDLIARHFWTISYPQIYPVLQRLERQGLIAGRADRTSRRRRKLYRLTPAGERALEPWLAAPEQPPLEIRDAGLLKVMFASDEVVARDQLARLAQRSREAIEHLTSTARPVAEALRDEGNPQPLLSVEFGIRLHRSIVRTCSTLAREFEV